jgi:uncharacterized protein with PQ loop repeat
MTELIGWASSLVLLGTILIQIRRQWHARHPEAVSPYLFVGPLAANLGFILYSALLGSTVFVVTNTALALAAIAGALVLRRARRLSDEGRG